MLNMKLKIMTEQDYKRFRQGNTILKFILFELLIIYLLLLYNGYLS